MRCLSACPCEADAMHVRRGRAMLQRCMIPKAVRPMRFQTAHADGTHESTLSTRMSTRSTSACACACSGGRVSARAL